MKNVGNFLSLTTLEFKLSKLSLMARFTWPRELNYLQDENIKGPLQALKFFKSY